MEFNREPLERRCGAVPGINMSDKLTNNVAWTKDEKVPKQDFHCEVELLWKGHDIEGICYESVRAGGHLIQICDVIWENPACGGGSTINLDQPFR